MYSVVVVNMDVSFGRNGMMRKVICMPYLVDGRMITSKKSSMPDMNSFRNRLIPLTIVVKIK